MSLIETRLGGNAPGLPVPSPLPSISSALSRRAALFGAVTVAGVTAVAAVPAMARAETLSPNDAQLVALADAYVALDAEVNATRSTEPQYPSLIARYESLEEELVETPADGLPGILAKARVCQVPTARDCVTEIPISIADDVWRLFGSGVSA